MEQVLLTLLIIASLYLFVQSVWKRLRRVAEGKGSLRIDPIGKRLLRFLKEVLFQSKIIRQRPVAGASHALVFWGFLIFLLASFHHFATKYGWHPLGQGAFHRIYSTVVAVFAVLCS